MTTADLNELKESKRKWEAASEEYGAMARASMLHSLNYCDRLHYDELFGRMIDAEKELTRRMLVHADALIAAAEAEMGRRWGRGCRSTGSTSCGRAGTRT